MVQEQAILDEISWTNLQGLGFPGGSVVKNPPANEGDTGDVGLIPGSGRSLGEGNGNPLQYSCLGNPMDRGAWRASAHDVAKVLDMTQRLNNNRSNMMQGTELEPKQPGNWFQLCYTDCVALGKSINHLDLYNLLHKAEDWVR